MPNTYGGFSMPGNDFFYMSSMYSDKLLTEFLPVVKNQAYQRYIQIQKNLLNGNEICGTIQKSNSSKYYFKESLELNETFDFPLGSIYVDITDQDFYLDIGDKLKFIRKFKSFTTPISSNDIIKNPTIFTSVIRCMLGNYFFNNFYILKDKYQRTYIGIKNSSTDGLSSAALQKLISDGTTDNPTTFCFWKDNHSACYTYNGILNSIIFNSTASGMKRINIPKANSLNGIYHTKDNNWSIVMSYDGLKYGNLLCSLTNVSLVSETNSALIFDIPTTFINDISSRNMTVSCIAIQKPNRKAIYAYDPNSDSEPWLALGDIDRPVSIANVKIYQYDESTGTYQRRIPIELSNFNTEFNAVVSNDSYNENLFFSNIIFPSIYKFDKIKTPIRMELIEFNNNISNTKFINHIKPLFENGYDASTGKYTYDTYTYLEYLTWLNTHKTDETYGTQILNALNKLTSYNPMSIYMDYKDFKKSGLSLREYKFGKLLELIASDPYIYAEYIKFMDKQNYNIYRETGSPKYFKINTGLTGNLTGNNPVVNDDKFTCVNKNDEVTFFSEPNSYIKVHSDNPNAYCAVFVGGRMITPTRVKTKLNEIYIFISQSTMIKYIQEALDLFKTRSDLNENNLITVEVYNNVDRTNVNQLHYSTSFSSVGEDQKLFDGADNFKFRLSDLVIYNKITGEYIPLSKFDIKAVLSQGTVNFDDGTKDFISGTKENLIYLGTNLEELYMTKDTVSIILDEETEDIEFPKNDTSSGGRKDNYSGYANKVWNASDLLFSINDSKMIGTDIEFVYSPVAYSWDIPLERFTENEDNYTYKIGGFIAKNDAKLFDVYIDGEFLYSEPYLTLPDAVSTDSKITITIPKPIVTWYNNENHVIQLRYNPVSYSRELGTAKYLISDQCPKISEKIDYTNYTLKLSPLYECKDLNHYFNSDNSRVFIYNSEDLSHTALMRPYTWNIGDNKIDLQDITGTSVLHPMLIKYNSNEYPVMNDLNRDKSFITNSRATNSRSIIDQLTI